MVALQILVLSVQVRILYAQLLIKTDNIMKQFKVKTFSFKADMIDFVNENKIETVVSVIYHLGNYQLYYYE